METFSRVDLFDTKGMEYLFVIAYLLILIIFWRLSNKPLQIKTQIQQAMGYLSAGILRIPRGLFYNKQHTWAHMEKSGLAKIGMDDFLQHLTGSIVFNKLRSPGQEIKKGDMITEFEKDGKKLRLFSPISGEIVSTNEQLFDQPTMVNDDPYQLGWLYQVKPSNWMVETRNYYFAENAAAWISKELERVKDFLMVGSMRKYASEPSMVILQDGGELCDHILSDLPLEIWNDFQKEFLDPDMPKNK